MKKSVDETPSRGSLTPLKRRVFCDPPAEGNKMQKNLNDAEEIRKMIPQWVTVYGFSQKDIKLVLGEFDKCGWILEHVAGPETANWVHILYQGKIDVLIALNKCGMQLNKDVILGVMKTVNPIKRRALTEEWIKTHAYNPERFEQAFNQRLRLLSRDGNLFYVLGETGNVYTVFICTTPSCNCPDMHSPCKHILFVLLRVLGISPRNDCLQSNTLTLTDSQVGYISNMKYFTRFFAGDRACKRFYHLRKTMSNVGPPQKIQLETGEKCPHSEGDLNKADPVVKCEACGEVGHESGCSICKAHWRPVPDENCYLNLAAYVSESENDDCSTQMKAEVIFD